MLSITELTPCFLPSFFFSSVPFLLNLLPDNHCHPTNSTCVTSASCLSCCIKLDLGPQQGQTSGLWVTRGELEGTKLQGIMSMCWNPLLRVCKVWWCDICSSECQRLGWNCFGLYRKKKNYKFTVCFKAFERRSNAKEFLVTVLTGNGVPNELGLQVTAVYLGAQSAKVSLFLCKHAVISKYFRSLWLWYLYLLF